MRIWFGTSEGKHKRYVTICDFEFQWGKLSKSLVVWTPKGNKVTIRKARTGERTPRGG